MATPVFVSYDFDHDARLKDLLVGQSKNSDTPFEIADTSVTTASPGWKEDARRRIKRSDQVIVLCGRDTNSAAGVTIEVQIARDEGVPYFLLAGYDDAVKPTGALASDKVYTWTWENLKKLIAGGR